MKKRLAVLAVVLLLSVNSASEAGACYTAREFEAEQGVRIHSELMVIGLTCMKMPQGQALYRKYQSFTQQHSRLIAGYETDLISYYGREGASNPEQKFHTLRTSLANEISRRTISMGVASFCQQFSPRIDQALAMDEQKLRRWAQHVWVQQPVSERVCARTAQQG